MSEDELDWLARTAENRRVIVELGPWKGRSTKALSITPGVVIPVDAWSASLNGGNNTQPSFDEARAEFKKNLRFELGIGKVILVEMPTIAAVDTVRKLTRGADMIFIDAGHSYERVKADIDAYLPLLSDNGIFCGHDYHPSWTGVVKAVDERIPSAANPVGSIWCMPRIGQPDVSRESGSLESSGAAGETAV